MNFLFISILIISALSLAKSDALIQVNRLNKFLKADSSVSYADSVNVFINERYKFHLNGDYLGCYNDFSNENLNLVSFIIPDMSINKCINQCLSKNFTYAGTKEMNNCKCGNALEMSTLAKDQNDCNCLCSGNSEEYCGCRSKIRIFKIDNRTYDEEVLAEYKGCYEDKASKFTHVFGSLSITNRLCIELCYYLNYNYSATGEGSSCYCTNFNLNQTEKLNEDQCNTDCNGKSKKYPKCGSSSNKRTVFKLEKRGVSLEFPHIVNINKEYEYKLKLKSRNVTLDVALDFGDESFKSYTMHDELRISKMYTMNGTFRLKLTFMNSNLNLNPIVKVTNVYTINDLIHKPDQIEQIDSFTFIKFNYNPSLYEKDYLECVNHCLKFYLPCDSFILYNDKYYLYESETFDSINTKLEQLKASYSDSFHKDSLVIGFKTRVKYERLNGMYLGAGYYKNTSKVKEKEAGCFRSCLNDDECIGVSYKSKNCFYYNDIKYSKNEDKASVSYIRSHTLGYHINKYGLSLYNDTITEMKIESCLDKCYDSNCGYITYKRGMTSKISDYLCSFTPSSDANLNVYEDETRFIIVNNKDKFKTNEIIGVKISGEPYDSLYTLNQRECWVYCENEASCNAASFNLNNFNEDAFKFGSRFNCILFNNSETETVSNDKSWISYINIKGFEKKSLLLDEISMSKYYLGEMENLTLTKCLGLCDATELCYSVSFRVGGSCVMYKHKPQYKKFVSGLTRPDQPTFVFVNEKKDLRTYGETCIDNNCDTDKGLRCKETQCVCDSPLEYWSNNENKCKNCRKGWYPYLDSCYKFFPNANRNWQEANKFCISNNSTLLTLKDDVKFELFKSIFKNDQVYNEISPQIVKSWIGASRDLDKNFVWLKDDTAIDPLFWSEDYNKNSRYKPSSLIEGCVGLDAQLDYKLNDLKCNNIYPFYCEHSCKAKPKSLSRFFDFSYYKRKLNRTMMKIDGFFKNVKINCTCYDGWEMYDEEKTVCVKLFTKEASNFYEAKKFCESDKLKSKLVIIKDDTKYDFIRKWSEGTADSNEETSYNKFWVNSYTQKIAMDFKWEDGSQILPEFWAQHQPDNNAENCILMEKKSDYYLNKKSCYFKNDFICEYEKNEENFNTCANGWISAETECFKLFSSNHWYKANEICLSYNSSLLSIQSLKKFNIIQVYLKKQKLNGYRNDIWVGSAKFYEKEFTWYDDKSPINENYWAPDRNPLKTNDCAVIDANKQNLMNTYSCNMQLDHYCEYA